MRRLPEDVKQVALWTAKGYQRRVKEYHGDGRRGGRRMDKKTRAREFERMEAVEQAMVAIGADIEAEEVRERLRAAILLNIESGRRWPYERLDLPGVTRSDFYRRKDAFLEAIAVRLGLV